MKTNLGVNIDHVATLRQARRGSSPDPVTAAAIAELAGATQITLHLREDRRHIQERDLRLMRQTVQTELNLEMAATDEIARIALDVRPDTVTLVPERREELTTEGGLEVAGQKERLKPFIRAFLDAGIRVSLTSPLTRSRSAPRSKSARRASSCTPGVTPTPPHARSGRTSCGASKRGPIWRVSSA